MWTSKLAVVVTIYVFIFCFHMQVHSMYIQHCKRNMLYFLFFKDSMLCTYLHDMAAFCERLFFIKFDEVTSHLRRTLVI